MLFTAATQLTTWIQISQNQHIFWASNSARWEITLYPSNYMSLVWITCLTMPWWTTTGWAGAVILRVRSWKRKLIVAQRSKFTDETCIPKSSDTAALRLLFTKRYWKTQYKQATDISGCTLWLSDRVWSNSLIILAWFQWWRGDRQDSFFSCDTP